MKLPLTIFSILACSGEDGECHRLEANRRGWSGSGHGIVYFELTVKPGDVQRSSHAEIRKIMGLKN
jgi:hypothetical protein